MRKFVLIPAAVAAAMLLALLVPSPASADGTTVISIGPSQYTIGFQHPTGTISVGGGTISARCTAGSVKASAFYLTPQCVTRLIACPVTASSCSVVVNIHESALRGPVWVAGTLVLSGGYTSSTVLTPYNCPGAYSCGTRIRFDGLTPGETLQLGTFNVIDAPNYATVFGQLTLTVS